MRAREFIYEAAAPSVGRKYQHVEDLIFTGIPSRGISPGVEAGRHAVRIIKDMATQSKGQNEIKWDGSPVVYWGKQDGVFYLIPKNAWEYLKRGKTQLDNGVKTAPTSADEVSAFLLGTGKPDPEREAQRKQYAKQMASLWSYFEQASPEEGFLEGGLLFYPGTKPNGETAKPVLNKETGEYDFTPNITGFHIGKDSDLGRRIKSAKVMVAATGYYESLGSSDEGRYPDPEELSTNDTIVQGTVYVESAPGVDESLIDDAESFINNNGEAINAFLSPKPGLSKVGEVLYKFYNQNLRVAGVKQKFVDWANQNLSAPQAKKIISDPGLDAILSAVEKLSVAKLDMYQRASGGTHSGIRQTKPEGYVYKDPDTDQFVKAISQADWAPRKD